MPKWLPLLLVIVLGLLGLGAGLREDGFSPTAATYAIWVIAALVAVVGVAYGLRASRVPSGLPAPEMSAEPPPIIVPVRYGDGRLGESLYLTNQGGTAYDVSVRPIKLGNWNVSFGNGGGKIGPSEVAEFPAFIDDGRHNVPRLSDPWPEWTPRPGEPGNPVVLVTIMCDDSSHNQYLTHVRIERTIDGGWSVALDRRETL